MDYCELLHGKRFPLNVKLGIDSGNNKQIIDALGDA